MDTYMFDEAMKKIEHKEEIIGNLTRQSNDWMEDARRYCKNAEYWENECKKIYEETNSLRAELEQVKGELDKTRIISGHHTIKLANADAELETVRQIAREALEVGLETAWKTALRQIAGEKEGE